MPRKESHAQSGQIKVPGILINHCLLSLAAHHLHCRNLRSSQRCNAAILHRRHVSSGRHEDPDSVSQTVPLPPCPRSDHTRYEFHRAYPGGASLQDVPFVPHCSRQVHPYPSRSQQCHHLSVSADRLPTSPPLRGIETKPTTTLLLPRHGKPAIMTLIVLCHPSVNGLFTR